MIDELNEMDDFILDEDENNLTFNKKSSKNLKTTALQIKFVGYATLIISGIYFLMYFINTFKYFGVGYRITGGFLFGLLFSMGGLALMVYCASTLIQYGNHLDKFLTRGKAFDLEAAFEKQRIYWTIVAVILVLMFFVAIFAFIGVLYPPNI